MDHLAEAKRNYESLIPFFEDEASCSSFVAEALSYSSHTSLGKDEVPENLTCFLCEAKKDSSGPKPMDAPAYLCFERHLLCIIDALLETSFIREFQKAVALDKVRNRFLLPIVIENDALHRFLNTKNENPSLWKHTPRGF